MKCHGSIPMLLCGVLLAAGCGAAPMGMYGHDPQTLWQEPVSVRRSDLPSPAAGLPAMVIKRFENRAVAPVGGRFRGASGTPSMEQTYTSDSDLALPLYQGVLQELKAADYPVWADYDSNPVAIMAPPGNQEFIILHVVLRHLEIDTFEVVGNTGTQSQRQSDEPDANANQTTPELQVYDAAMATLEIQSRGATGNTLSSFTIAARVRIERKSGDIMAILARHLAIELAAAVNRSHHDA